MKIQFYKWFSLLSLPLFLISSFTAHATEDEDKTKSSPVKMAPQPPAPSEETSRLMQALLQLPSLNEMENLQKIGQPVLATLQFANQAPEVFTLFVVDDNDPLPFTRAPTLYLFKNALDDLMGFSDESVPLPFESDSN
jgi:hypothetical protein